MVLPQPSDLDFVRNVETIENLEEDTQEEENQDQQQDEECEHLETRRSTRMLQLSTRLRDYVTYSVKYPIENYISYKKSHANIRHI
jgi:hypothetical protein